MTQDSGGLVGERVRLASGILVRRNPAHDPKSANKVDVGRLHLVKTKIVKIHPIAGILVAAEVQFPHRAGFRLWDRQYYANEGNTGGAQGVLAALLHDQQAGARIRLQVLRMHGHAADEEHRPALFVGAIGHHGAEGEPGLFARVGRERPDAPKLYESAPALGKRGLRNRRVFGRGRSGMLPGRRHRPDFSLSLYYLAYPSSVVAHALVRAGPRGHPPLLGTPDSAACELIVIEEYLTLQSQGYTIRICHRHDCLYGYRSFSCHPARNIAILPSCKLPAGRYASPADPPISRRGPQPKGCRRPYRPHPVHARRNRTGGRDAAPARRRSQSARRRERLDAADARHPQEPARRRARSAGWRRAGGQPRPLRGNCADDGRRLRLQPLVELLLERGANPRAATPDGYNVLAAALGGSPDIDHFTLGSCQAATVRALKRKDPSLHLPDNLWARVAQLSGGVAKLRGCPY